MTYIMYHLLNLIFVAFFIYYIALKKHYLIKLVSLKGNAFNGLIAYSSQANKVSGEDHRMADCPLNWSYNKITIQPCPLSLTSCLLVPIATRLSPRRRPSILPRGADFTDASRAEFFTAGTTGFQALHTLLGEFCPIWVSPSLPYKL